MEVSLSVEFVAYPKTPRLFKDIIVTEKIDGTNAQIYINEDGEFQVGSRNRWIAPGDDNYGFAKWAYENKEQLIKLLGPGRHFGEWWGEGVQRGYGIKGKRFSLFNVGRWGDHSTEETLIDGLLYTVPILYRGEFSEEALKTCELDLQHFGSKASPGFMRPEGYVVYHTAANQVFKVPFDK